MPPSYISVLTLTVLCLRDVHKNTFIPSWLWHLNTRNISFPRTLSSSISNPWGIYIRYWLKFVWHLLYLHFWDLRWSKAGFFNEEIINLYIRRFVAGFSVNNIYCRQVCVHVIVYTWPSVYSSTGWFIYSMCPILNQHNFLFREDR